MAGQVTSSFKKAVLGSLLSALATLCVAAYKQDPIVKQIHDAAGLD